MPRAIAAFAIATLPRHGHDDATRLQRHCRFDATTLMR